MTALPPRPAPGVYAIVNRVLSPNDERLAITFNGSDQPATATVRTDSPAQRWVIADYDTRTQSVSPQSSQNLQAAWGSGFVTVLPAGNYVWTIRNTDTGYTIQDGGVTVFWGVANAVDGAEVTIGDGTGNEKQRWFFEKI
ncbi:hypothetical protein K503DRAFT_768162 [Rhizopogon vinicolor AM-OR11-026]|uniref:CCL2-like lectin domain-containing protein n=1 Tax=Rhizopogon vinicolor AM-OR11-026 TaxID=1314800 RepID=A0A1B7N7U4_9AGAM|nr:hypothetical protein K503DRAFT_768162 [Rhizopogon vinicolor AM-OR11-026]